MLLLHFFLKKIYNEKATSSIKVHNPFRTITTAINSWKKKREVSYCKVRIRWKAITPALTKFITFRYKTVTLFSPPSSEKKKIDEEVTRKKTIFYFLLNKRKIGKEKVRREILMNVVIDNKMDGSLKKEIHFGRHGDVAHR